MFGKIIFATLVVGAAFGLMVPVTPTKSPALLAVQHVAVPAAPSIDTVINRSENGHFYVDAQVNGQLVHFVVDTGASNVALTKADAQHVGLPFSAEQFTIIGRGASGDVYGQQVKIGRVAIGQKEAFDVDGAVLDDGLDVSLLGQSFLSRIGSVTISGDQMILR